MSDNWNARTDDSTGEPHLVSSAARGWSVHSDDAYANRYWDGGTVYLRVYDSPTARLAAEQSVPQGVSSETKLHGGSDEPTWAVDDRHYRCLASCGAVSVEVRAESTGQDVVAWANDAIVQSQTGLAGHIR
jgi:hypothetical protein